MVVYCTRRLKVLKASWNVLEKLPLHVFRITSLEVLDVSHNKLKCLPGPDVASEDYLSSESSSTANDKRPWLCYRLTELNVSHNCLDRLPETVGSALHLQKFNAAGNRLTSFPFSLSGARFLEQVNLSENNLQSEKSETETSMRWLSNSVQQLLLSGNNLDRIPPSVLSIGRLQKLDCANNSITSLPSEDEWQLPLLHTLILSRNNLGRNEGGIELPDSFSNSLIRLDMSHNQLMEFPEAVLKLKLLVSLKLDGSVPLPD